MVEDNFLVYGKQEQELRIIANNLLSAIRGLDYRPFDAECKGNPCFEVGDPVRLSTKYEIVESYILSRTLKGTQALKDSYSAAGAEKYEIKVNSTSREISQVSGRTEQLEREYDEQQEDIENINTDIDDINQDIGEINSNVGNLKIELKKTNDGLHAEVSRATSAEAYIGSRVDMTESSIEAEVRRAQDSENYLSSRINMTAESITAEVARATQEEGRLSSQLSITANQISTKVTAGEVTSLIEQNARSIRMKADAIVINSTYFSVDQYGVINAQSGTIGPFSLTNNGFSGPGIYVTGSQLWVNNITARTGNTVNLQGSLEINDNLTANANVKFLGVYYNTTSGDANVHIGSAGNLSTKSGSSKRWKHDIKPISDSSIDPHKLYKTRTYEFIYNDDYISLSDHRK